jgi:adenylate cyclase
MLPLEGRTEVPLLIVFGELTRFFAEAEGRTDADSAAGLDAYYRQLDAAVAAAGGRVVKFIGDGVLFVFPEPALEQGLALLPALKQAVDDAMSARGWQCRFLCRAHFGTVVAGPFGPDGRFDVVGRAVNAAARLRGSGIVLSEELVKKRTTP